MDLWVCIPLPLVFLTSKTLTSSEKGTHYPQPIIIQNHYFKSLLKREYSVLIIVVTGSNIIVCSVWKSQRRRNLQPPLLTLYVWNSSLPACCHIWVSLLQPSYQGSSERARSERPPKQGGVLWPSSRTRADSYSDRGFQTLTCRGHTARGTMGLRHVLRLGYFYTNALSLFGKRKENEDKQAQQRGHFLYLSSVYNTVINMRCNTMWKLHLMHLSVAFTLA